MVDAAALPCCGNCPFVVRLRSPAAIGHETLECRRLPPAAHMLMSNQGPVLVSKFPAVEAAWCCAEHPSWSDRLLIASAEYDQRG